MHRLALKFGLAELGEGRVLDTVCLALLILAEVLAGQTPHVRLAVDGQRISCTHSSLLGSMLTGR